MTIEPIIAATITAAAAYIAIIERRIAAMQSKIGKNVTQAEVEHLIDIKQSSTDIRLKDLKEDLKEMKQDLKEIKEKL